LTYSKLEASFKGGGGRGGGGGGGGERERERERERESHFIDNKKVTKVGKHIALSGNTAFGLVPAKVCHMS
jgi:hypothetical protein